MAEAKEAEVYEMLLSVVRSLVDRPEDVEIESIPGATGVTFRILAHPTDMGKLIGVNGRTARALRTIVAANASRLKRNFSLDIVQGQDARASTARQ